MSDFATVEDIVTLCRNLTLAEEQRAQALLPIVSDSLRVEAEKAGKNLDKMIETNSALANVAKSVTVDVVMRALNTSTTAEPQTQFSQSAMGYSASGSFLVPGGGLFIKKSELKRLGLIRQRVGTVELYDGYKRNFDNSDS